MGSVLTWICEQERHLRPGLPRLRLVLIAYFPPSGHGLMVPIFVLGERLVADSHVYRVRSPAELSEFVAFAMHREGFRCSGPYAVAPPELQHDPGVVLAMHAVLMQRMGREKAVARLTPIGEYEGITPNGRFRWIGTPSEERPDLVDVRLLWSPETKGGRTASPERLLEFSLALPPELAELQLLVAAALLLFPYNETWRPRGHHELEGKLVPPPQLPS